MRIPCTPTTVIFLAALAVTGCANYAPGIRADENPTANDAYLYGRFYIDAAKAKLAFGGHNSMGFSIKCSSGQVYTIGFSVDNPLQVIKIVPSTCTLSEFVYSDADGIVRSRKPAPDGLMRDVRFHAGRAYYLGDFYAAATVTVSGRIIHTNWQLKNAVDDYEMTTTKMRAAYPNLSAVATEDRMIGKNEPQGRARP